MRKVKRALSIVFMLLICAMAVPMLSWGSPAVAENKKAEAAQSTSEITYKEEVTKEEVKEEATGEVTATEKPVETAEPAKPSEAPVSTPKPEEKPVSTPTQQPAATPVQTQQPSTPGHTHTHSWNPVYRTVHHEEVGHYDTKVITPAYDEKVLVREAWDEQVLVREAYDEVVGETVWSYIFCTTCGWQSPTHYNSNAPELASQAFSEKYAHGAETGHGGYSSKCYTVQDTIHHDAEYKTVHHEAECKTVHHDAVTEKVWVVDAKAYDEKVLDHYECSCGERKAK